MGHYSQSTLISGQDVRLATCISIHGRRTTPPKIIRGRLYIKLLLLGTLCVGGDVLASASAGNKCDVIDEDANDLPAPAKPSPFQAELDAVQAAKAAFIEDTSPDSLRANVASVVALFNAMHKENETHSQGFVRAVLECATVEAAAQQTQYIALVQGGLNAEVKRHYFPEIDPSLIQEDGGLKMRMCAGYLGMTKSVPVDFAKKNLAQEQLYAHIGGLSRKHQDMIANEAWTFLKVEASSLKVDHTFLVNFLSLQKPLQDLLFVTKGDKTHESWEVRIGRISERARSDPAWTTIITMDADALVKNLTPLIEKHQELRDDIAARDSVAQARKGFEAFDHFNTCYNQVASLFWAVEKALLDAIMQDKTDGATKNKNRFMPLLEAWSDKDVSEDDRIRELIIGTLEALMQKRFALTKMMYRRDQSPGALVQQPPSLAPSPESEVPHAEEVNVCDEDQDA